MKTLLNIFLIFLAISVLAHAKSKYGEGITPFSKDHAFFKKSEAPDFWLLIGQYRPQEQGNSCSAATLTMLLNALNASKEMSSEDKFLKEQPAVASSKDQVWIKNVSKTGKGMTLDQLKNAAEALLTKNGYQAKVEMHFAGATKLEDFKTALKQNQKTAHDFIVINFDQGYLMQDSSVGHIAIIGAYEEASSRALVLDPDREWYEPYWVSDEKIFNAMKTIDTVSKKSRGWLYIELK